MRSFVNTTRSSDAKPSRDRASSDYGLPTSVSSAKKVQEIFTTPLVEKLYRGVTSPLRLLPDFLIIGAQRSGTTSLYHYLQTSPCIGAASIKEIHFVDLRFNK